MSQSTSRGGGGGGTRFVGDYVVGRQIGSGSFSVVWHAKHRVHGTEVAIKEIVTGRLNKKLHESLMSEIVILKQIDHPNIIKLHDIIEETGRIHLVLEYCRGGDLFMYIQQRQGKLPEGTAKFFMQQLATGLQILRQNNLIHRDLKPQNLLLSANRESATLKIADFGFARSLHPRNLAETLCGSPLYMAPEIMQLQKYDAKADLWSVGAILFQLVTGKPPFTGNNQIQLLQNIVKSTELQFPLDKKDLSVDCIDLCRKLLRRNPVERLTFEEFFNHPFLCQRQPDESLRRSPRRKDNVPSSDCGPAQKAEQSSREDCLPFSLDDDTIGLDSRRPTIKSTYGFSLGNKADRTEVSNPIVNLDVASTRGNLIHKTGIMGFRLDKNTAAEEKLKESLKLADPTPLNTLSKVLDSLELIDQDYVIVSGPPLDGSSSSQSASKLGHLPCKLESTQQASAIVNPISSIPMPIVGTSSRSVGSHESVPSQGSMDIGDALEHSSTNCMTRIKSLQRFVTVIRDLVKEKVEGNKPLEAFSLQLVILAIWKQALHICHTQAVSAVEGSPTQDVARRESSSTMHEQELSDSAENRGPHDICSQVEKEFLTEVGNAEELAKIIEPGSTDMPDAMETIYQAALAIGKHGAVDEYFGSTESSAALYTKAVRLLMFLLVEAPSLILNPPFSLTASDRYRLQTYIDVINNRQNYSRSQRMALLKCEDQLQGPP